MKIKYIYHDSPEDLKYPYLVDAICEVFETVKQSKFAKYFGRVKVHFYSGPVFGKSSRAYAFMMPSLFGPEFFFSINGLHGEFGLQSWLSASIAKSPVFNDTHSIRITAGHEIGHWIVLNVMAKSLRYGRSIHVAQAFGKKKYYKNTKQDEILLSSMSDTDAQLSYRNVYPERWSDKYSRIILSLLPNKGRDKDVDPLKLCQVHIKGLGNR